MIIVMELHYVICENENNVKVSKVLLEKMSISSRLLTKLKMNEKIIVNGEPVFSNYIVHEGDFLTVKLDFLEEDFIVPEPMNLNILYEDEYILAINKPAGIVVHPSANHLNGTLANGVKDYLKNHKKIRAINRLDRDTSGIVLFAKNEYVQELMIKKTNIQKEYIAIIDGILNKKFGTINKPIQRKKGSIMEREVSEEGQIAITHYKVIRELEIINSDIEEKSINQRTANSQLSVVKIQLETGRTHQIRVHMSYIGAPILGDSLYGNESDIIARQALHAFHVSFQHPIINQLIDIKAPLPEDMKKILQ